MRGANAYIGSIGTAIFNDHAGACGYATGECATATRHLEAGQDASAGRPESPFRAGRS